MSSVDVRMWFGALQFEPVGVDISLVLCAEQHVSERIDIGWWGSVVGICGVVGVW